MELSTLEAFAEGLKAKFALPGSASPEDQLKPSVAEIFKQSGSEYGLTVETRTETHLSEHKVRPDMPAGWRKSALPVFRPRQQRRRGTSALLVKNMSEFFHSDHHFSLEVDTAI